MTKEKKLNVIGSIFLVLATISWGTSFTILKDTINEVPKYFVLGFRFVVSGILLSLIFFKSLKKLNKKSFLHGVFLGITLSIAYLTQTLGLEHTTPGKNAFLTSLYSILCPFLFWITYKKRPTVYNFVASVLCLVGVGFIVLSGKDNSGESEFIGEFFTIISAVFYAIQILIISKSKDNKYPPMGVLSVGVFVVGIFFTILSLIFELPIRPDDFILTSEQWLNVLYLTFVCTIFAQFAQFFGQQYTLPNQSAILLSLESVFGVFFSILWGKEEVSFLLILGFFIVFCSVMVSELQGQFLSAIKQFMNKRRK